MVTALASMTCLFWLLSIRMLALLLVLMACIWSAIAYGVMMGCIAMLVILLGLAGKAIKLTRPPPTMTGEIGLLPLLRLCATKSWLLTVMLLVILWTFDVCIR